MVQELIKTKRSEEYSVAQKPWGKELLVEHNEKYAFKEIIMSKGTRSSLQSHQFKLETIYVVEGCIQLNIEGKDSQTIEQIFHPNESYTIPPSVKHRVIVLEDARLFEVSTPELDDLIRHSDDYNRA
jgi:mannose-6-phosphate isomerase